MTKDTRQAIGFLLGALLCLWLSTFAVHYLRGGQSIGEPFDFWWNVPLILTIMLLMLLCGIVGARIARGK